MEALIGATAVAGIAVGIAVMMLVQGTSRGKRARAARDEAALIRASAEQDRKNAEEEKKRALLEAKEAALKAKQEADAELRDRRREVQRAESRLANREESLDARQQSVELREERVVEREAEAEQAVGDAESIKAEQSAKLEEIANLSVQEAKTQIMQAAEADMEHDLAKRYYDLERKMLSEVDDKAKKAIALSIQRLASDVVNESTTLAGRAPQRRDEGAAHRARRPATSAPSKPPPASTSS